MAQSEVSERDGHCMFFLLGHCPMYLPTCERLHHLETDVAVKALGCVGVLRVLCTLGLVRSFCTYRARLHRKLCAKGARVTRGCQGSFTSRVGLHCIRLGSNALTSSGAVPRNQQGLFARACVFVGPYCPLS